MLEQQVRRHRQSKWRLGITYRRDQTLKLIFTVHECTEENTVLHVRRAGNNTKNKQLLLTSTSILTA